MNQVPEIDVIKFSLKFRIYENALLLCQDLFARKPSQQVLYYYAKAYLESGSPIQATILCQQNLSLVNPFPKNRNLYAQALFECGKYNEAETVIKPLLQNSDTEVPEKIRIASQYLVAMIKLRTHRHLQAQSDFHSVLQTQPLLISALLHSQKDISVVQPTLPQTTTHKLLTPKQLRSSLHQSTISSSNLSTSTNLSKNMVNKSNAYRRNSKTVTIPTISILKSKNLSKTIDELPLESRNSILGLKLLAIDYFKSSKYIEASKIFSKLYQLHPHTVEGLDIYSTVLWQLKDEKKLSLLVHHSIEIAPNKPEPWIAMGNLFSLQHNSEEAIKMFTRAASIDNTCSYALALAGHEKLVFEALNDASKLFRQAIDRNPNEWSAWYGLGSVYFQQDNFAPAEYYMKKALEINPKSSVLHYVNQDSPYYIDILLKTNI